MTREEFWRRFGREMDPEKDVCRFCVQHIGRDRLFYRDDRQPGEAESINRWIHRDCFEQSLLRHQ